MAKTKTKKKQKRLTRCIECRNAYLMQSAPKNPIIVKCHNLADRRVASTPMQCEKFLQRKTKPEIHPMIFLDRMGREIKQK